ncbi:MAG: DUF362 domain-containing protein [Candidatus Micrarchaeota archaeon]|nr:DUF362 domain-containing protein [Candidatus Micrarchaeota archaeon]
MRPTLQEALGSVNSEVKNRIRGAQVLIKPNFVDPQIPRACSTPAAIGTVARWAFFHGADRVLVGDDGCLHSQEKMLGSGIKTFSSRAGDLLGVTDELRKVVAETGKKAGYIEMASLRTVEFEGILLRDTSEFMVVNLTLPKVHGEYEFSGVCKNLIGLIPPEKRSETVHPSSGREIGLELKYAVSSDTSIKPLCSPQIVYVDESNRQKQFDVMQKLINYARTAGNFLLHVIDGSMGLILHEHFGPRVKLGFAAAGTDPVQVDSICYKYLNIPSVFYLPGGQVGKMAGKQVLIYDSDSQGLWTGLELSNKK